MAKNDQVLIDGIIDERVQSKNPSDDRGEVFEFFALEELLKFADLSAEDIKTGWVDGNNDGGIDGFYTFVNGLLITDTRGFPWPKSKAEVDVWIITCKHADTFSQAPLDKLVATLSELLDFSVKSIDLKDRYSPELLQARDHLTASYRTLATRIATFNVNIAYASRGDTGSLGQAVTARATQLEGVIRQLFGNCQVAVHFVGASELVAMQRKTRKYSLKLPFLQSLSQGERYVLLASLKEYDRFVRDEDGRVRRYLFDSNVRDFAGLNRVNEEIAKSLKAEEGPDFWWLNNGITILVTNAVITGQAIVLDDVQIVNGLQTTESIARYFAGGGADARNRAVLVKVIKSSDAAARDAIIRATNTQTEVEQQSLHATDKIQRDIEEILVRHGWYYDRRKNFYANQGMAPERIVSPLYLAAAAVGVLHTHPGVASGMKQRHLRKVGVYGNVFSEHVDLTAWPALVSIVKVVDHHLDQLRGGSGTGEHFLKRWRHLVAFLVVARELGRFSFSASDIAKFDASKVTLDKVKDAWFFIQSVATRDKYTGKKARISGHFVQRVAAAAAAHFDIKDPQSVEKAPARYQGEPPRGSFFKSNIPVDEAFLDLVDAALPAQPWKRGVDKVVAGELKCKPKKVWKAIQLLIARGRRNQQKDGVVYGSDGQVIAADTDRAPETGR
jgi:hypothetical protein